MVPGTAENLLLMLWMTALGVVSPGGGPSSLLSTSFIRADITDVFAVKSGLELRKFRLLFTTTQPLKCHILNICSERKELRAEADLHPSASNPADQAEHHVES